ncbi:PREDICTED: gamma-interferon-inducible lysosomal thiol reductase-like [Nicrophorus vespilloides]|uniref:Gamma-interferon-inducible lysosomal thiol reductase-like n=1 Tax=Nicrophorus vespilloides TaxID=110193 RepID=A0ABM1MA30_NICVS|nr:PREDICTED: gamma-interferon-inducible lysosomal thiol reductase-like [Nicrophorus vespilloides]XP_017771427.1 PREDICTED: gamma-interferon-inducible lysosomal thiol reductase-like [Nicrophorus vespilloides]XP_017771428.1 PREDICTED: gamma-interferon-inducible lysosomal thiol reductase-like [Nicrophorus vespilloides]XP_017771429.1 PREDICTED: gamma-interferon-inducible lysosomal thiol reductase-like [Nicrophorus vespilloides]XP_017771430.1 PREDICTED: gamma-interferon-inducible lysosomal thiol re
MLLRVVLLLLFSVEVIRCDDVQQVKISLFYETYCPYSIKFLSEQLYPTTKKLSKYIDLDLVPYGKATREMKDGHWIFNCQHGDKECYGNKIHACALEQSKFKDNVDIVELLDCFVQTKYEDEKIKSCCKAVNYNYDRLKRCMIAKSEELLAAYGDRTDGNDPKVTFVPLVMFDDYYNRTLDDEGTENLLETVCKVLRPPLPKHCLNFYKIV